MTAKPVMFCLVALALALVVRDAASYPGEAHVLSSRALEAYRAGRFDEARELFAKAAAKAPGEALLRLGVGSAQYRLGDREAAAETFDNIFDSERSEITAAAKFNAGVVRHREAQEALSAIPKAPAQQAQALNGSPAGQPSQADPEARAKAINALEKALADYRLAILKAPGDVDMIYNYELARRQLDELKNQPPPPPQSQQDQKPEDNQQQPENKPQQEQPEQKSEQKKDEQKQQGQSDQDKPPEQNQSQQGPDQQQKPEQGNPDEQKQDEPQSGEQPPRQEQRPQPRSGGQPPAKPGEMTPEDVQRLLNTLPEGDQRALQRLFNARFQIRGDMEKDW
ncbi:MAG: tetratricopeptide repeat protein [Candidatus Sumerlaeaceae bacterium]|nr:tetratricopeptide repeat protein [Candidatus Sumerlaeaceae bacterium]